MRLIGIARGSTLPSVIAVLMGLFVVPAYGGDGLDLSGYERELLYSTEFENPDAHKIVDEEALFQNGDRQPLPDGTDWVYEGRDRAWIEDGELWIGSEKNPIPEDTNRGDKAIGLKRARYHSVLWNTRTFPDRFLLEFEVTQRTHKEGLNIVFFAARAREKHGGGSIFKPGLPKRAGRFNNYIKGAIDNYHISYIATNVYGSPRGHSNMRKNHGFHKVTDGEDYISQTDDPGPHTVRLLKDGNRIVLSENGKVALTYTDKGDVGGEPHGAGQIGLRQMRHSAICSYDHFKVWKISSN